MNQVPIRAALTLAALGLLAAMASGCGSSDDPPAGAAAVEIKLTDAGCEPHDAKAPAGPIEFEIENAGSSKVTEMEVLDGSTILGEEEDISSGLSDSFSLTLEPGQYTLRCSGGSAGDGTLTVRGG
jgi:iron uptake system component EfeO